MKKVYIIDGDANYVNMFKQAGYEVIKNLKDHPDILCFTGGEDVSPVLYKESPLRGTHFNTQRDKREELIFEAFKNTPKVGICRGGQFLNVMNKGAMWQHIDNHAVGRGHWIKNLLRIDQIPKDLNEVLATSTHHQMMIAGPDSEVIAVGIDREKDNGPLSQNHASGTKREVPDYDTEVVWYEGTKSLCFQPHPEYDHATAQLKKYFFSLIDYLIWEKGV